jgi:alkaline phosphatase
VRKVILFIGDGMGYSEMTLAGDYYYSAAGKLEMDAFQQTGSATTYSLQEQHTGKPELRYRFGSRRYGLDHRSKNAL